MPGLLHVGVRNVANVRTKTHVRGVARELFSQTFLRSSDRALADEDFAVDRLEEETNPNILDARIR